MKKIIVLAVIILLAISGLIFFSDGDDSQASHKDEIILVFEKTIPSADYQVVKEFLTLLTQLGIRSIDEYNIYTQRLEENTLALFIPKHSISVEQQTAIKQAIASKYTTYQKLKLVKSNQSTALNFDMKFELIIGPRIFDISDVIRDKEALARYKKDTAAFEKHYEQNVILGYMTDLESSMFGVRVKKVCAISLQTKKIPYQEIGLKRYMSEDTQKKIFRYSYAITNDDIYAKLLMQNAHFSEGSALAKVMQNNPNYRITAVVNRQSANPYQAYTNHQNQQSLPTTSSLYLVYDEIDIKPNQTIKDVKSCQWPADIAIPSDYYLKEHGFATAVIGIQFVTHP